MHVTSTVRARIEPGGDGVVAHVGLHALGRFADAVGDYADEGVGSSAGIAVEIPPANHVAAAGRVSPHGIQRRRRRLRREPPRQRVRRDDVGVAVESRPPDRG